MTALVVSRDLHAASSVTVTTRAGTLVSVACRCLGLQVAVMTCHHPEHVAPAEAALRARHRGHVCAALS